MGKKSIKKNYFYNLLYQILVLIMPLVTTPYISNVLGSNGVGIYSYTLSITTYFILFGSLGISMYGQREIAYVQNDKKEKTKIFWEIIILRLITMSISLLFFYIFYIFKNSECQIYYKILVLEFVLNILDISWFFQGMEEFKKTVIRNFIVKILSVILIFTVVKNNNDLIKYFIIYVGSGLLGNLSLWGYIPRYIEKINFKKLNITRHIKPTLALFIPQIAIQIYTLLDKVMIGKILNDMSEVGIYEQSQKIIKMPLTVITALGTVVSPRIASIISENKKNEVNSYLEKSFQFVWFMGIPMMFGIMAISSHLIPWFLGNDFEKAIQVVIIGAPIIMAIGLNNVTGIQYLISAKKQNIFTKSVVAGAIFNFVLNLIIIPKLKSVGAIMSSLLAETLILIIQIMYLKKEIPLRSIFSGAMKYILSGIIMFLVILCISQFMEISIISTGIEIIVGCLVYFSMLLFFKDKMLFDLLKKIKIRR